MMDCSTWQGDESADEIAGDYPSSGSNEDACLDGFEDKIQAEIANRDLKARIMLASCNKGNESGDNEDDLGKEYKEARNRLLPVKFEVAYARWNQLYNHDKHYHLQKYVMFAVYSNRK